MVIFFNLCWKEGLMAVGYYYFKLVILKHCMVDGEHSEIEQQINFFTACLLHATN
jgi:hypothetical protein